MIKRLVERHDKQVHRILEIIPGFLTWAVLLSPLWLGPFLPTAVAFFLSFLAIFWVYRAIVHTIGAFIGYRRFKKEMKVNWLTKAKKRKEFARLKHLIVIPTVKDPYEVLETTFASIANYNYPKDKIYVAFSTEERGEPERVLADIERLKKKYDKKLGTVWTFVHPAGIPGEAVGAAANRTWAAKNAVKKIEESGLNIDDFITTTFDSDMQIHPDYLARLSYAYMDDPEPNSKFFQTAVYLFDNNLWDVPSLMRIQANSVTLAVLSSWVFEANTKDTWSCFSVTLPTLVESDYWDTSLGVDDTPFFWRAFFAKGGEFEGHHFHVPVYADAVQGKTWLKAHTAQYKQLLRWGWGVITFPIAMKGMLTTKIPFRIKLEKIYHMIEQYTIWRTVTFLITFGFFLLAIANPNIRYTSLGYQLPQITGTILTCAFIFLLPVTILRTKITRPMPADWPFWKKVWAYLEGPLVIINLLTYALVPYIDAETRLMLGKRLEFWSTPKMRTKGNEATAA
jgi:hypothetical protein